MSIPVLQATLNAPFSVSLTEDASTGYLWRVAEASSEQLSLLDDGLQVETDASEIEDPQDVVCGGSHARTFAFQAHSRGTHRLRMERVRPWLGPDPNAVTQEWDVVVG